MMWLPAQTRLNHRARWTASVILITVLAMNKKWKYLRATRKHATLLAYLKVEPLEVLKGFLSPTKTNRLCKTSEETKSFINGFYQFWVGVLCKLAMAYRIASFCLGSTYIQSPHGWSTWERSSGKVSHFSIQSLRFSMWGNYCPLLWVE